MLRNWKFNEENRTTLTKRNTNDNINTEIWFQIYETVQLSNKFL